MRSRFLPTMLALTVAALAAVPGAASAATTIDTTGAWDGSTVVCPFGRPDTATYGQVITVPAEDSVLDGFTVYIRSAVELGYLSTFVFRGEVYAWDGAKASGPNLWESAPRTLTAPDTPEEVAFDTGGIELASGQQYVLFASISKDYEENADLNLGCWGWISTEAYGGGDFVFQNNGGDESQWTSQPWDGFGTSDDLAFKASFSAPGPTSKDQCKNGGWRNFPGFRNQGQCVSFVATGGNKQR